MFVPGTANASRNWHHPTTLTNSLADSVSNLPGTRPPHLLRSVVELGEPTAQWPQVWQALGKRLAFSTYSHNPPTSPCQMRNQSKKLRASRQRPLAFSKTSRSHGGLPLRRQQLWNLDEHLCKASHLGLNHSKGLHHAYDPSLRACVCDTPQIRNSLLDFVTIRITSKMAQGHHHRQVHQVWHSRVQAIRY